MRTAIIWDYFQKILPFKSEFFHPTHNAALSDATLSFITQSIKQLLPDTIVFALPNEKSSDISLYFQAEDGGGMIAGLEYQHMSDDGTTTSNVAVIVGEICMKTINNQHIAIIPHYILLGKKQTSEGQIALVVDMLSCRAIDSSPDHHVMFECDPNNNNDLCEALCYVDECFLRISAGLPLDVMSAQEWLEASDTDLNQRINWITSRSHKQISIEIAELQKKTMVQDLTNFQMPAPRPLQ